jgi:acetylcholinesterase
MADTLQALHMLNPAFIGNSTNSTGMMNSTTTMNTTMTAPINSNATASKNTTAPFRGAIMQSGAMSTFPIGPANETRQPIFDRISLLTGCSTNASTAYPMANATAQFNQTEFECLRTLPNDMLFNATRTVLDDPMNAYGNFPFGPTIDFDLVPASPAALLAQGKFAKNIPFISGNMLDEGTLFTPPTINTTAELTTYIDEVLPRDPNSTVISTLLSYYNNPADGSPFGTGNSTFGLTNISPL